MIYLSLVRGAFRRSITPRVLKLFLGRKRAVEDSLSVTRKPTQDSESRGIDSWLARAIEGGGRGRIGVDVFEDAGRRSGLDVDGAPGTGEGGGAFDVVSAARNAGETEADTGGNQFDGNDFRNFAVSDPGCTRPEDMPHAPPVWSSPGLQERFHARSGVSS